MAEKYYPIGPYNYCLGNPIRLIDPNGMETTDALERWIEELEKEIDDMKRRNNAEITRYEAERTAKNSKRTYEKDFWIVGGWLRAMLCLPADIKIREI